MKQILRGVATLLATTGPAIGFGGGASALPTADFAVSASSPNLDESVTFTASAFCDEPPCRFQWRWYRTVGNDRLGTTMGEGEEIQ